MRGEGQVHDDAANVRSQCGLGDTDELHGTEKDVREHRTIETAGVGVAEGGVVTAEEGEAVGEEVLGAVGEGVGGAAFDDSLPEEMGEVAVPGDLAEADDDANFGERGDLCGEMGGAVANLLWSGLVAGRGAADDGTDPELAELEAVVAADGHGFGGEAELVEDGVHEVSGAVAGEGATGAIGSVGSGGEAEDEDAGVAVAEAGDGLSPVFLVAVGFAAVLADAAAVVAQSGTASAGGNAVLQQLEDVQVIDGARLLGTHGTSFSGNALDLQSLVDDNVEDGRNVVSHPNERS